MSWLLLVVSTFGISLDCPDVISLAQGLRMNIKQPSIFTVIQSDCCTANGVGCDGGPRVIAIKWSGLGLDGTLQDTYLPNNLQNLVLANNRIIGNIVALPSTLQNIDVAGNLLNGSLPLLPTGLLTLNASQNQFSGSLPTLPNNLTEFRANRNKLTGAIPMLPSSLQKFDVSGNVLNGSLPSLPIRILLFDASQNQVSGSIPTLPNSLIEIRLNQNKISGIIPILPITLQFLKLWNNKLNSSIPALPSSLEYLDLSHNQLVGTLPSPLPNGLEFLRVHNNQLSGNVPSLPLPLYDLWLGNSGFPGNYFSGTIMLNRPTNIRINDNLISNVIILDLSQLIYCDLSNNPLLGSPNISELTICIKNNLYFESKSTAIQIITNRFSETSKYTINEAPHSELLKIHSTTRLIQTIMLETVLPFTRPKILIVVLFQLMRLSINTVILGFAIYTTPFSRELKTRLIKRKKENLDESF